MRIGILGGTFDPIHIAHLHAGEVALNQARLDTVLFMPAGEPWQKAKRTVTPVEQRLEMVRLATSEVDGFEVDDREITREGPTYTLDTLNSFTNDEELFLVLGADAAMGMASWYRHEEVLERSTVLVVPRPGTDSTEVSAVVPDAVFLDMSVLEISGTEIRELASAGQPFRFLVTKEVHSYVVSTGLYIQESQADKVGDSQDPEEKS